MTWHVLWDNGSDACGEFPWDFDTREAAEAWGADWLATFLVDNAIEGDEDDEFERPGFDVIEVARPANDPADDDYEDDLWDMTRRTR